MSPVLYQFLDMEKNLCRYYEAEIPVVNELVMVEIKSIDELSTKVILLEYNNKLGKIMSSEFSSRKVKSLRKIMKVGRKMPAAVLSLESERNNINLSTRNLSRTELKKCDERYQKSKIVHSIVSYIADVFHNDIKDLYATLFWPLAKIYGHPFEALKKMLQNSHDVFKDSSIKIGEEVKNTILKKFSQKIFKKNSKLS